jgi:uracil-DNA glycosylase family 4
MAFVPAGSDHPAEVADRTTPVAHDAPDVVRLSESAMHLDRLDARVSVCRACPRLVEWRERVADERRASFAEDVYWGRPVPSWGPVDARVGILGLAPAAHGGNRTGRIFTGDRSGDWLFAALHSAGLARQPTSVHAGDGQQLIDTRITAAVHCAPPQNAPLPEEREACSPWLVRELRLLTSLRVVVTLGGFAWKSFWPAAVAAGLDPPPRRRAFGHGVEVEVVASDLVVLGCFHPSQQNTFTGKLTESMLDDVFGRAAEIARDSESGAR